MNLLREITDNAIAPALKMLPAHMDSPQARVMLLAICGQESGLRHRVQITDGGGRGPARGLAQFEVGSKASRGGVWGVYLHPASRELLRGICAARDVAHNPPAIWAELEHDDILALAVARLLLYTDPQPLPAVTDEPGAWACYLRTWRPGKPHPDRWPPNHRAAVRAVMGVD